MGGLPCYEKVLQDGRLQKTANNLIAESKITTDLLAAKGYYDSPLLQDFINLEAEIEGILKSYISKLSSMNDSFAQEDI